VRKKTGVLQRTPQPDNIDELWEEFLIEKEKRKALLEAIPKDERKKAWDRKYRKKRFNSDIEYRITANLRSRMKSVIANAKANKCTNSMKLIGCNTRFLRAYLEAQFVDGMTWDNYGLRGWHIDHIRPCASFDLTKPDNQRKCFHWSNLQPLWWRDNLEKSAKWDG
jgi:hypothetical protein